MTRKEALHELAQAIERRGGEGAKRTDTGYLRSLAGDFRYKNSHRKNEFWDEVVSVIMTGAWSAGRASEYDWLKRTGGLKR